jgi:hypothetical protein
VQEIDCAMPQPHEGIELLKKLYGFASKGSIGALLDIR